MNSSIGFEPWFFKCSWNDDLFDFLRRTDSLINVQEVQKEPNAKHDLI